jgi:hypothetical protein
MLYSRWRWWRRNHANQLIGLLLKVWGIGTAKLTRHWQLGCSSVQQLEDLIRKFEMCDLCWLKGCAAEGKFTPSKWKLEQLLSPKLQVLKDFYQLVQSLCNCNCIIRKAKAISPLSVVECLLDKF